MLSAVLLLVFGLAAPRTSATSAQGAPAPTVDYRCGTVSPGASTCTAFEGERVYLFWSSSNATSCLLDGQNLGLSNLGYTRRSLPIKTTISSSVVCSGPGGSVSRTITIDVVPTVYADTFPGADAGERITAAIQSLSPVVGGTVDATRFTGDQVISNTIRLDRPVRLLLGNNVFEFRGGAAGYKPTTDPTARYVIYVSKPGSIVTGSSQARTILRVPAAYIYNGIAPAAAGTRVTNLTIEGPGRRATPSQGINTGNMTRVEISNVTVRKWGSHGINTGGSSLEWTIADNVVESNFDDGVLLARGTSSCTVTRNVIRSNGSNGVDVNGSLNHITANTVLRNGYEYESKGVDNWGILLTSRPNAPVRDNVVSGNTVGASAGQNIILRGVDGVETSGNLVSNNVVFGATAANGDGIAIDGTGGGTIVRNTITGNTVRHNARFGILIAGTGATLVAENTITRNLVEASGSSEIAVVSSPVNAGLAVNNTVTDNQVVGGGRVPAVDVWPSTNSIVSGNSVKNGSIPRLDIDGDGDGDLFTYNAASGQWAARRSREPGTFAIVSGTWGSGLTVLPADFNGDAFGDLFVTSAATGQWFVAINTGANGWTIRASGSWRTGWQPFVVDLDGDHLDDVFLWDAATGGWFKCLFTGEGFTYVQGVWSAGWRVYPARLKVGGARDFFLFNPNSGQWFTVLNNGAGGFTYPQSGFWSTDWQLHAGDFTGDGLTDVLLYRPNTGYYRVAASSNGGFTYQAGFFSTGWTVLPVDLDGDARTDLVMHNPTSGQWFQMVRDAAGVFGVLGSGYWKPGMAAYATDFDGDGRGDVFLYGTATGQWYEARNRGTGRFELTGGSWAANLTIVVPRPS